MRFERWEIWEADVPYVDDPNMSKKRPVLIIAPDKVMVLKITTHGHSDKPKPYEFEIAKWEDAGLPAQSYVQCEKYVNLDADRFTGKQFGKLKACDIVLLQQMMKYHNLMLSD